MSATPSPRPRRTARAPSYRLHKADGRAFVQVKGKRHYLGKHGTAESLRAYAGFLARLADADQVGEAEPPEPAHQGTDPLTVVELLAAYWAHAQDLYSKDGQPTGWLAAVRSALTPVREIYGPTLASEFGPRKLKAVRDQYVQAGLRRDTANRYVGIVKRMFKWAVAEEFVPPGVYQALAAVEGLRKGRTPAPESRPVGTVDDQVIEATLPHLPPVVADMVRFQRLCGCRPGEVCSLRPGDVDRSGRLWTYTPAEHKTAHHGRARTIVIGPKAQDVLRPYLLRPADAWCFSPAESEQCRLAQRHAQRQTPLSHGNRPGSNRRRRPKRRPRQRYDKNSFRRAIQYAVEKANRAIVQTHLAAGGRPDDAPVLPAWTPNQLRHTAATEIRRRFGLEAAQVILGHSKADVTQVYAERNERLAFEIMDRIG